LLSRQQDTPFRILSEDEARVYLAQVEAAPAPVEEMADAPAPAPEGGDAAPADVAMADE
jgi:hypothetical protein